MKPSEVIERLQRIRQFYLDTIKDDTAVEAVDMAIKAVEKQEQTKEVIPHRNYQYLSDYWCECGWHLGKYNDVKFCADCGRKINWGKRKYTHPEPYTEEEE